MSDRAHDHSQREWRAVEGVVVRDLALLVAAIETGTLTEAARAAHLTQPGASKRIALLERHYGLALLERSHSGVRPTEAGRVLYAEARQVLAGLDRADAAMRELGRRARLTLRVAASYTIGELLLPDWLAALRLRNPEVLVDAHVGNSADVVERVLAGDADLGFVETPDPPPGFDHRSVGSDLLTAVAAPSHPLARASRIDADALQAHTLVTREEGSGTRETAERWLALLGAQPRDRLALSSTGAVRGAAEAGMGFALLSRRAVVRELAAGTLVELTLAEPAPERPLLAIWRPGGPPAPAASALLDAIAPAGRTL